MKPRTTKKSKKVETEKVWYYYALGNHHVWSVISEEKAKKDIEQNHLKYLGGETWIDRDETYTIFAREEKKI